MNISMSLVDIAILKSVGPDAQKIINTLKFFGPNYKYVIGGYPPFLKSLVDTKGFPWKKYDILAFFGGEGISESMREYLQKAFTQIYGSYGASDLEINIAAENDFTISLRNEIMQNKKLFQKLVKHSNLPMIFQYNPLDYYIETNAEGELLVTLCRLANVAPKVRYNIHDLGHVVRMPELLRIMKESGVSPKKIGKPLTDLPLLFHYGRSDSAIAFYGCKITPAEIETIIFENSKLAPVIHSFALLIAEDGASNKTLTLALEMRDKAPLLQGEKTEVAKEIFDALKTKNQDYREASKMIPHGLEPRVEIHLFGTGPFAVNDIRLKNHYIQKR